MRDDDLFSHPVYESIELQPGVAYMERGRSKKSIKTFNEAYGKITRAEYEQKYNGWITNANVSQERVFSSTTNSIVPQDLRLSTTNALLGKKEAAQRNLIFSQPASQNFQTLSKYSDIQRGLPINASTNFDKKQLIVNNFLSIETDRKYSISPNNYLPVQSQRESIISSNEDQIDRFNIDIVGDDKWGNNIVNKDAKLVMKMDIKRAKDTKSVASKLRFPKERRSILRYSSKERLPPPILGRTIGHGQIKLFSRESVTSK